VNRRRKWEDNVKMDPKNVVGLNWLRIGGSDGLL